jgi:hypothetical protein
VEIGGVRKGISVDDLFRLEECEIEVIKQIILV